MSVRKFPTGPAIRVTLKNEAGKQRKVVVTGDGKGMTVYDVVRLDGQSWLVMKIEPTKILWSGGPR